MSLYRFYNLHKSDLETNSNFGSLSPYLQENFKTKRKWKIEKYITNISKEDIIVGMVTGAVVAGATLLYAAGGAIIGAICGEILDHLPYLNTAISDTLNTIFHTNYFTGNLDKLGATLGFISGFFKKCIEIEAKR
jgi:hypothetical protein